jgi:hypothetical protein
MRKDLYHFTDVVFISCEEGNERGGVRPDPCGAMT